MLQRKQQHVSQQSLVRSFLAAAPATWHVHESDTCAVTAIAHAAREEVEVTIGREDWQAEKGEGGGRGGQIAEMREGGEEGSMIESYEVHHRESDDMQ